MKKKRAAWGSMSGIILGHIFLLTGPVFAQDPETGLGIAAGIAEIKSSDPATLIGKIVGAALSFVGVVFFILMIYGGILWMIARGDEQQVTKAKDLIIAAIIGIAIVIGSYAITSFVFTDVISNIR